MGLNQVRVSFYVDVEADKMSEIDKAMNNLLDQIGNVETDLSWEDVSWDLVRVPQPLDKESN